MPTHSFKFFAKFIALVLVCLLHVSCDFGNFITPSYDESFESYLDYWSSTCEVGQVNYVSSNVKMSNGPNVSAQNQIEIDVIVINPKEYALLCKSGGGNCFRFQNEAGDLVYTNYSEEMIDPSKIKIKANLTDASEGQTITLTGCLWPENTSNFTEDALRRQNQKLFYSENFIQNTPPDEVRNVYVPSGMMANKHYVSFEIPDQTKNKNQGVKFEIQYFLRENSGLTKKGSRVLSLSDSKTSGNVFTYYFDEQEDYLAYEYSVKVLGVRGLNLDPVSTDPGLGVHVMVEPTITFETPLTGHVDAQGYEYIEVESDSSTVSYSISSEEAGAELSGTLDGVSFTGVQNGTLAVGAHTIVATVHKDRCRDVTVTRKIMVARTMNGATLTFTGVTYNNIDTNGFRYYEVNTNADVVPYSIIATEDNVTLTGTVDDIPFSGSTSGDLAIGEHTLVATVSRENYNDVMVTEKIMVVKKLAPAVLTFSPTFNGCGEDGGNYEYIEVATSSATVSYGIAMPESGTTITGTIDGTTFSGDQSGVFAIGAHSITATIHRDYYHDITVTKNVMVVKKLDTPNIEISGTTYNNVDTSGYKYYEVASAAGKVGYTISSENETTITSSLGNVSTNIKQGELGINSYVITATAKKPYHLDSETASMKIQVVKKLEAPNIEFTGTTYNKFDGDNYLYYEVDSAAGNIGYSIASENGTTITSSLGNVTTNLKEGELGIDSYVITATAKKPYHNDSATVTKKVKVVQKLQKPSLSYYSDSDRTSTVLRGTPYDSAYNSWSCYDINLDSSGNASLYYTFAAQETGATLTATDRAGNASNSTGIDNSGSFVLGPHTITLTVAKEFYETQTFTESLYVEGVLADAVIRPTGINTGGTNWQFSYLTYSAMPVSVSVGNAGNTISSINNGSNVQGTSFTLAHGYGGNIVVTQTRQYCRQKQTTQYMSVSIKPITVSVPANADLDLRYDGDDAGGDDGELYGYIDFGFNGGNWQESRFLDKVGGFPEGNYSGINHSAFSHTFTSIDGNSVCYRSREMTEWDNTWADDDPCGNVEASLSLYDMCATKRSGGRPKIECSSRDGDEGVSHRVYFTLTD